MRVDTEQTLFQTNVEVISWLAYFVQIKVVSVILSVWQGNTYPVRNFQHILELSSIHQKHSPVLCVLYLVWITLGNILQPFSICQISLCIQKGFHVSVSADHYYPKIQIASHPLLMVCNPLIQICVSFNTPTNCTVYFCVVSSASVPV